MRGGLIPLLALVLTLAGVSEVGYAARFGSSGSFSPYNYYRMVEGEVAPYHLGFFRAVYASNPGSIDRYAEYRCYSSSRQQFYIDSIQIMQVGNELDPYLRENAFTYNYTNVDLQSSSNYGLVSSVVGNYEGCLITILWNKIFSGTTITSTQIDRATYQIGRHLNQVHNQTTEFYTLNKFTQVYTGCASSYDNLKNNFHPVCQIQNYYWHPYLKTFFFLDRDNDYNHRKVIFTCFPYNTPPQSACDADFDQSGTASFRSYNYMYYNGRDTYYHSVMHVGFTKGYAYMAFGYYYRPSGYRWLAMIFRMTSSGSSCSNYCMSRNTEVYRADDYITNDNYPLNRIAVIKNVGVAFLRSNRPGIHIMPLNSDGTALSSIYSPNLIETGRYWKLHQLPVDSVEDPPLFGIPSNEKDCVYRITNVATKIYTNSTLNFYDNPVNTGRFHLMVVMPGHCYETTATANYAYAHVVFVNLESLEVDFCIEEVPRASSTSDAEACGNGVLDGSEECDDGNRRSGDGCKSDCTIEPGWRCYNTPYQSKSQCEPNECGDGYVNPDAPEFEVCDDGNLVSGDGCSVDCRKIERGYYCGTPGQPCIKVCPDGTINDIEGMPHHLYAYKETCDDGNDADGDGCSGDCMAVEKGWECPTPGTACNRICSNSRLDPAYLDVAAETCDDGNLANEDGCSSTCQIEFPYKCPTPGQPCYHPCGDNVLDQVTGYIEECDDGNLVNGDGCNSNCQKETLPRTYTYNVPNYGIVKEQNVIVSHSSGTVNDCRSPYVPAPSGTSYTPKPSSSSYVCYIGRHCYKCTEPRFPGYPLEKDKLLSDSPYGTLASVNRGRMRAMHHGDEVGISFVANGRTIIKNYGSDFEISHDSIGAVRLGIGRYYIQSKGTNQLELYWIDSDPALPCKIQKLHTSTKIIPPQQGNDFFIWWPGHNLLMSRQFNGRDFDFFSLHANTTNNLEHGSCSESLRFDGAITPSLEIPGDILMDPVFRGGRMYVPLYIEDLGNPSQKKYQVAIYEMMLPFQILLVETVVVPNEIVSIASFSEGVVVTLKGATPFFGIDSRSGCSIIYTGTSVSVDTAVTPAWVLVQDRADPDDPRESKPVYGYATRTTLYAIRYDFATSKIIVDSQYPFNLPDDEPESRHTTGRFNLAFPHDITGKFFVNFGIHPCSTYVLYRWDEYNYMQASIFDLELNTTRCVDIPLSDATFA